MISQTASRCKILQKIVERGLGVICKSKNTKLKHPVILMMSNELILYSRSVFGYNGATAQEPLHLLYQPRRQLAGG